MFAALVLNVDPLHPWLARAVLGVVALAIMIANMPNRKGFVIAINYVVDRVAEDGRS